MSNKKQFEYIEEKIRQAADQLQPEFEAPAWEKMNALLDREDGKKRPFFWLWFALPLFFAGSFWLYSSNSDKRLAENSIAGSTKTVSATDGAAAYDDKSTNTVTRPAIAKKRAPAAETSLITESKSAAEKTSSGISAYSTNKNKVSKLPATANVPLVANPGTSGTQTVHFSKKQNNRQKTAGKKTIKASNGEIASETEDESDKPVEVATTIIEKKKSPLDKDAAAVAKVNQPTDSSNQIKQEEKSNTTDHAQQKKPDSKRKNKTKGLYFLGTGGADMGSVKLLSFNNSKIIMKYGVGVGYQLNNRWSVQTGFYVSNKKYTAGPGDYHPKQGSYWNQVDIKKVDAACLVYEIPLMVRYNIIAKPSLAFYAAAGASSYIMKKEDYNYHYMRYNQYNEQNWQYTGNSHLFSELILAAGFEKKVTGKLSLLAEPSVSIPISGVGDGSVKLFSAAVQLGFKYMPF